jgi:hypothetical protein
LVTVHRVVTDPKPGFSALVELTNDPLDLDDILSIRALTDTAARDVLEILQRVAPDDRYTGPRAASVMAPFMFKAESRFSPGTYGVLYAAQTLEIAVRESAYHAEGKLAAAKMSPCLIPRVAFRLLLHEVSMADVRPGGFDDPKNPDLYDPDPTRYAAAQRVGKRLRDAGKWSVRYTSVRKPPGSCFGVFVPRAIDFVEEEAQNLRLTWDGTRISEIEIISTLYL